MKTIVFAGVAALALSATAGADFYTTDGNLLDVPDNAYDGSLGSMAFLTIDVGDSFTIADINVMVDLDHTWAGDLVFKLMSPGGSLVTLMSRTGYEELADDGTGCCGLSHNFIFGNEYWFDDEAGGTSEDLSAFDIGGTLDPFSVASSGFGADPVLNALYGEGSLGTWTLYIGDSAGGDLGVFDGFTMELIAVPAPGALALLGLAGLVGTRRRRG